MQRWIWIAAAAALSAASGANSAWAATDLICSGHGSLGKSGSATGTTDYADQVRIHLDGAASTITLSDIMVPSPVLPYARKKSLWPLTGVVTGDDRIEADIQFDVIRRAHVAIDRVNGNLTITGYDSFTGICTPYDPAEVKKLF